MRFTVLFLFAVALLPSLSSAQSQPRVAKAVPVEKAVPAAKAVPSQSADPATVGQSPNVVLRPNDSFDLRLSGMPSEDAAQFVGTPCTIDGDGSVSILYAGRIQAAGKTPGELEHAIEKAFIDKKIFQWPKATINVITTLRGVTVGGTVRQPQRMAWSSDLTLLSAIMTAGGPGDFSKDKVNLVRAGKTNQYRMKALKKDPTRDPKLLPGDQVELL